MALTATALKLVAGGGDSNLFMYQSADAVSTIAGSGYFNSVTSNLKQFDIIIAVGSTGGTRTVDMLVVQTNTGTGLTTVLGT